MIMKKTMTKAERQIRSVDERTLILECRNGCDEAKEEVLRRYKDLVWDVVHKVKYLASGTEIPDIYQTGIIGLYKAVDYWDYTRNCKFSTYATKTIARYIERELENTDSIIRKPVHMQKTKRDVNHKNSQFYAEHGRLPTIEELSRLTGATIKSVTNALYCTEEPLSLDLPLKDGETDTLASLVADPGRYENRVERNIIIEELLESLEERERDIIEDRFWRDKSLREVGEQWGVSHERIRQIESETLLKLRMRLSRTFDLTKLDGTVDQNRVKETIACLVA